MQQKKTEGVEETGHENKRHEGNKNNERGRA